jgi:hypothetical protein
MPALTLFPKTLVAAAAMAQGQGGTTAGANQFNPQISIVGDFVSVLDHTVRDERTTDFREIEFGFAAEADPFLRVEAYIALANEGGETVTEIEEAFGRYSRLGRGLSAKVGKIAAAIGRVQRNHADQLGYLDYPLVIRDVFGDEGMRLPGASLSYLFPGERFHELTLETLVLNDEGPVFASDSTDDKAYVLHYRTFFDFNEDLSASLGATYVSGQAAGSDRRANVCGLDYTMKFQPGGTGRSWVFEAEGYSTKVPGASQRRSGWFARLMVEAAPKLWLTAGYDRSEIPGTSEHRSGTLFGVTKKVTEFHHWRLEWQRISSSFERAASVLTLQFQWVIGAHPAHRY